MKNPKNKDVGTPRKHGTTSPKKNNIDFTENTPGVMTRSQVKCHYLSTPKKISKEIKTTPTENSRKCSNVACAEPVSGTKRSLRSGVSISIKRQKKEGLDTSDNPDLTDTSIEDDSIRTSKPRYNRCSKEPKNLEGEMNEELDKVKKISTPRIKVKETLNENKLLPDTNKEYSIRSRRSVVNKLENDMSGKGNEPKQINSLKDNKDKQLEIVNESVVNKDEIRLTRSVSKKLESKINSRRDVAKKLEKDRNDEDIKKGPPSGRESVSKCPEILDENRRSLSTSKEGNAESESGVTKKLENDKSVADVQITSQYSETLDENKLSPSASKGSKAKSRKSMPKKLETEMSDMDNERKKIKSPEVRKDMDEYPEHNKIISPEVRKNLDEYPKILYDSRSPPKAKLKRNLSKNVEIGTSDEGSEYNKIKSPEVRKDVDEYPEILYDSKSPPKTKLKRNMSKKLEVGTSGEDNEHNKIKSHEVRKDVDEYPEILYDNKSLPKAKLKRNVSKKLEVGISDKGNVAKEIITSEIKKVKEIYAETLFDNKSSPKINKDKSISKKLKSDSSDEDNESSNEDNEHNKIESPEIRKDVDRYLEIHYADKSPKTKLKRSVYKKFEDDTSDENNVVKQVRSSEGSKNLEILYDSKSSPYKNRDKTKLKRNMSLSPAKKAETSPMVENDISDSGSESGKVKISRKESKQQVASIAEHVSLDSSEAETIIFENTGKTLFLSETIKSDKRKNYLDGNEKTIQDSIPPSHEENSVSVGEIFASSSGVTSKILSIAPKRENILNKKFSSPEKNKGETEFQIKENFSTKDRISSSETISLPKTTKQAHLSPFRNQTKQVLNSESSDSDSDAESRKAIRESAQKRIIQNISTSESDSKFMRPVAKLYDEQSDSESAPEEMSFSAGRKLEMESLKNVVESINKDKQKRKERRKQRLEKYKQQKEEKLIRLKEKRASQEDASCSSSEESGYEEDAIPVTLGKSKKKQRPKLEKENVDDPLKGKIKRFNISEDEIEIKERKEKKRKHEQMELPQNNLQELPSDVVESLPDQIPLKVPKFDKETSSVDKRKSSKLDKVKGKRQDFRSCNDLDYIPLSSYGSTEFGVMPLEMLSRSSKSMAEQAADFKQRMLYGSHIKRAPANAHLVYQQKLKAAGRDRFAR